MESTKPKIVTKICSNCNDEKRIDEFYTRGNICCECNNYNRREKYKNNEEYRQKIIKQAINFKQRKISEKHKLKEDEQNMIGIDNKLCKYCNEIKHNERFRNKRLKCRDCERDDPTEKFKRYIRTRIYNCFKNKNKTKHSVEYLGCSSDEYFNWIFSYNNNYILENHGSIWHIDHVIPISKFDLTNDQEKLIAFNWRNTMPLSVKENLSKNNKIIPIQIEHHYKKLLEYHLENNIILPHEFIDLFAKHLVAGSPLEPL